MSSLLECAPFVVWKIPLLLPPLASAVVISLARFVADVPAQLRSTALLPGGGVAERPR